MLMIKNSGTKHKQTTMYRESHNMTFGFSIAQARQPFVITPQKPNGDQQHDGHSGGVCV